MEISLEKRESGKRCLSTPSLPAKRLKQATLPFKLLVTPRNPSRENVKPVKLISPDKKVPVLMLHKVDHILNNRATTSSETIINEVDCKENENPCNKTLHSNSSNCKSLKNNPDFEGNCLLPLVIDLTDDNNEQENIKEEIEDKSEPVKEVTSSDDSTIIDTEEASEIREDQEIIALTPVVELKIEEGAVEVNEKDIGIKSSPSCVQEPSTNNQQQIVTKEKLSPPSTSKKQKLDVGVTSPSDNSNSKKALKEEIKKQKSEEKSASILKRRQEREEKRQEEIRKKLEKKQEEEKRKLEKKQEEEKRKLEKKQQQDEIKRLKQEIIDEKVKAKQEKKLQKELLLKEKEAEKEKAEQVQKLQEDKVKAVFASFFVKKDAATVAEQPGGLFQSFKTSDDMRLAPLYRNKYSNSPNLVENLDKWMCLQDATELYLNNLINKKIVPGKCPPTWPCSDVDVCIIESYPERKQESKLKRKYFKFSENVRPPYSGTWRKRSSAIRPKNPFRKDEKLLNYEADSDDEWEEEPGESLSQSEDENESDDNYEVDNDLFVPHGYLSEGEGDDDGDVNKESASPETLKIKLKMKELEFEKDMKKKCQPIKPFVIGCLWVSTEQSGTRELDDFAAVVLAVGPIDTKFTLRMDIVKDTKCPSYKHGSAKSNHTGSTLSDVEIPWFIKLVHGNQHNQRIIYGEFQEFWSRGILKMEDTGVEANQTYWPRKSVLQRTLKHIAKWEKISQPGPMFNEKAWCVKSEFLSKYNLQNISLPNNWKYNTNTSAKLTASPSIKPDVANLPTSISSELISSNLISVN